MKQNNNLVAITEILKNTFKLGLVFLEHLIQSNKTIGALSNITRVPRCEGDKEYVILSG
ncbi:MAG: hypothetical protein JO327_03530 [Nitrososphaeraceae archaeon]|nr:hypothetical protein [Nitrososphaeraceae archaeon]